jgi:glutamine---fructose-6-phosphate transaminase (isomerizing)
MCGITAILAKNNSNIISLLLESLKQLENRGYDSVGFSIHKPVEKNKYEFLNYKHINSDLKDFENKVIYLKDNFQPISTGIGHTRWATHGGITMQNCHPHISNSGLFHLVHNGIIENYHHLKDFLKNEGFIFYSQTDTEVIVNLIDYYFKKTGNIIESIKRTQGELTGTYGIALLFKNEPNTIYIFRNGSPMLVGENSEFIVATSEISGFAKQMKNYIVLEPKDICIITPSGIRFSEKIVYNENIITDLSYSLTPHPYDHWTLKEINEQSESLERALNFGARISDDKIKLGGIDFLYPYFQPKQQFFSNVVSIGRENYNNIILCGCGSSYFACQIASFIFKKYRIFNNIQVIDGAEFNKNDIPPVDKTIIVLVSQSGETKDLHRVVEIANEYDCITLGVINVVDSLIAREVTGGIYINCGREKAVASTKSMTSSTLVLHLMSLWFYQTKNMLSNNLIKEINWCRKLTNQVKKMNATLYPNIKPFLKSLNHDNMFLLGKGKMEFVAKEGALKIKEICYIHAEGYSGSALKHGPFALLKDGFPVILLIDKENKSKMMNVYEEVKSRGCFCLVITDIFDDQMIQNFNNNYILLNENPFYNEILYLIVLQKIAYYLSLERKINPDKPRNLAKVVTVE